MEKKKLEKIISIVVVILVLVGIGFFFYNKSKQPGEHDQVAQCLAEKGVVMYGAWWCPHCKAQKEEFGKSFKYIKYVECALPGNQKGQTQECNDAGVKGYPTWKFPDGTVFEGEQSIKKLAETAKCEIQK
ncbi:hypothetical protein HY249_00710 [Candidatus Azambacteria bacterium]|nr:hypothetical protein [Candidatus Azambacteria bacterium]